MRRLDSSARFILAAAVLALPALAQADDEPAPRFRAPLQVLEPAPFVQLAVPAGAYAKSESPGLDDLRVVDSRDTRIPFAWLPPRAESRREEQRRPANLYALPARPAADGSWPAPVDITLDGNRVQVRRSAPVRAAARSGGWVIDLGEARADDARPSKLRLHWTGPDEFSVGYRLETSEDLRTWRPAPGGQLMALASASGPLAQRDVPLPPAPARFLRLVWTDAASAPAVDGAEAVIDTRRDITVDAPAELVVSGQPAAAEPREPQPPRGALVYDLGGALPVVSLELRFATGTHVAPVRVQARERAGEAWRDAGSAVFYRIERDGAVATAPMLELRTTARWLRVVPDPRAGALDAATVSLVVRAELARLVFVMQGQPPYAVLLGAPRASPAALPAPTLVPDMERERARFGAATLGAWSEDAAASRRAEADQRTAEWRPRVLWAVLVAGVLALAFMVWRLARAPSAAPAPVDPSPPA